MEIQSFFTMIYLAILFLGYVRRHDEQERYINITFYIYELKERH